MKNKLFLPLSFLALFFNAGCGDNQQKQADTPARPTVTCTASARQVNKVLFGDHGGGDTVGNHSVKMLGGGCINQGICEPVSNNSQAINVAFSYTQGSGNTPSTFFFMFPYAQLFQNQPGVATFFYNNAPIATYPFVSNFPLNALGGNFAQVCDQVNAGNAGAGTISYNPAINPQNPPPNASMTSTVTVTFTVTPTPPPPPRS